VAWRSRGCRNWSDFKPMRSDLGEDMIGRNGELSLILTLLSDS
jgi:hypothetical protein